MLYEVDIPVAYCSIFKKMKFCCPHLSFDQGSVEMNRRKLTDEEL